MSKKGKHIIKTARSYCEIMDGLKLIVRSMEEGDIITIKSLTNAPKKGRGIIEVLKWWIELGVNISFNSEYSKFKLNSKARVKVSGN